MLIRCRAWAERVASTRWTWHQRRAALWFSVAQSSDFPLVSSHLVASPVAELISVTRARARCLSLSLANDTRRLPIPSTCLYLHVLLDRTYIRGLVQ